jgi:hypothetical protein
MQKSAKRVKNDFFFCENEEITTKHYAMLPFSASQCNIKRVVFPVDYKNKTLKCLWLILRRHKMALERPDTTRSTREIEGICEIYELEKRTTHLEHRRLDRTATSM